MPFAINGSCGRCFRKFSLTVDESLQSILKCESCGEQIVRRIAGYVYVLSNPEMPGLLKIGQTTRSVTERVVELNSATGVPCPFVVEAWFESIDPPSHESSIHSQLSACRLPNREFFRVSLAEAARAISTITGSDAKGIAPKQCDPAPLLPPSQSAYRTSIFKRWRCAICSKEFKGVKGICCGQQASRIS